jgi:hypothetical protein
MLFGNLYGGGGGTATEQQAAKYRVKEIQFGTVIVGVAELKKSGEAGSYCYF